MDCYIKQIIIFSKEGEKRFVSLERGLNIITGDSKTGKSALIEIVDYCLCSKTSNIPRGKISEFAYLFAITLAFPNKFLVIGRKNFFQGGNSKLYVKLETDEDAVNNIDLKYFESLTPILRKEAQEQIERNFNMSVANIAQSDDVESRDKRKASLREMTSLIFQHQNLIANKHALIYRFDDNYKRQAVIDSFPVFAGWADDEYFSLKRAIESKQKQLRQVELSQQKKEVARKNIEAELKGHFKNYYSLVGKEFNEDFNLTQLLALRGNLPIYTNETFTAPDLLNRYNLLRKEIEEKGTEQKILDRKIKDLQETENYANQFQIGLKSLNLKAENSTPAETTHTCPICGNENEEITQEMELISNAQRQLSKELEQLSGYKISYQKEIDSLKKQQADLRNEIRILINQKNEIEKINQNIEREKNISEQVIYARANLDVRIELLNTEEKIVVNDETDEIRGELEILNQKITEFSIENDYKTAETFLSQNMNKIGNKLDFEEELKPLKFWFDLKEFSFYHTAPGIGRITLNEMGSGANWLTCHLSLFLSFLHYLAKQKKSVVPSFLFLDQPSQVYFPSEFNLEEAEDNDIVQVEKVYVAILEELDEIEKEVGFMPQVIITDHADKLKLGKYTFDNYVRKRWNPENDGALI
jgi:hypothetical protein